MYRLNIILVKFPESYFIDINKLVLKWYVYVKTQNSQHDVEEKGPRQMTDTTHLQDLNHLSQHNNRDKAVFYQ